MRRWQSLAVITLLVLACELPSITISFGLPTSTPAWTPTATVNAQATTDAQATARAHEAATAQAQASAATQAQATATMQARATASAQMTATAAARAAATTQTQATATAQVRTTATAQVQATATAQARATATAQAQAAATTQALVSAINTLASNAKRVVYYKEGKISGAGVGIKSFRPDIMPLRNFVIEVRLSNPADPNIHPWDYGFGFREGARNEQYRLYINSDSTWRLVLPVQNLADRVEAKDIASGTLKNLDVATSGSNHLRLVVNDKWAFLFVNGEYITAMDVSERNREGALFLGTNFVVGHDFPGLVVNFQECIVSALP